MASILQRILPLICLFFFGCRIGNAQLTPDKLGFEKLSLHHKKWGEINYYHFTKGEKKIKPVLLYLDGSGAYPMFQMMERGTGSTIPFDYKKLAEEYHLLFISKPGIPFADSVSRDPESNHPLYPTPDEYTRRLSLDWRVNAADLVLKDALKKWKVDKRKIAILGFSEGFQVGSKLISVNKSITHAILMVGNGFTQFFDFIIQNRMDALNGVISEEDARRNIDSLHQVFADIKNDPLNTEKSWYGHSYLRWSSFCSEEPIESLLRTNIPVYFVSCTKDQNTSPLGLDYIYLRSVLDGKKNLKYIHYPYDHGFNEFITDGQANVLSVKNHMSEAMEEAFTWLRNQ
ncbi:MAG: hypothetical protein IPM48_07750 [Saprospiraceae bacterium]|nr:hypothetical protein [Saprospiraceae bacterium]